ncbi:MAG TPA: hypothetical protein VGT82_16190, partial [Ktedonobacteraceae bacterium]|nr:hypothetical protein [Ktedonobacteraceae bacterium]
FALTWNKQPPLKKHFRHVFLDTLLRDVQETDLATWSTLHKIVMQQGLPPEAVERWKFYLDRLGLLDQISATEETTRSTTAPSQSFWPLFGKRKKQPATVPLANSHEAAAPEHPEQHSPSAQMGPLLHKQPKAIDIRGSRPDANFSQGGIEFHVPGADSKQKRKR